METLKTPVSEKFHEALSYASVLHREQARKGTQIPYVSHLMAVSSLVMEAGGTEDEAIAALLHDAAEDQGGQKRLDEIRQRFGATVADIVEHCSDTFEVPKPAWPKRKRDYIKRLRKADRSTLLVSVADKVHNARATLRDLITDGLAVFDRFDATPEQTLRNYRVLMEVYTDGARDPRRFWLVDELWELVHRIEQRMTGNPG